MPMLKAIHVHEGSWVDWLRLIFQAGLQSCLCSRFWLQRSPASLNRANVSPKHGLCTCSSYCLVSLKGFGRPAVQWNFLHKHYTMKMLFSVTMHWKQRDIFFSFNKLWCISQRAIFLPLKGGYTEKCYNEIARYKILQTLWYLSTKPK